MKTKILPEKTDSNRRAKIAQILKNAYTFLIVATVVLFSVAKVRAQDVTGFGYGTYSSDVAGALNYGTISNPFTITYSGGNWKTQTLIAYPPVNIPVALSSYVAPANMLELGAWVVNNPAVPPFPTATYTFTSPLPATSVMFIQDVDALESFQIEFLDASGTLLNPSTIGAFNNAATPRATASLSSTTLTVTAIDNVNSGESLSDFVFNSGLVKQVRITQIASRDDLSASGTAEFYFAAPSTPTTDNESSLDNPVGSNVTLDLLMGDLLGNGTQATPALVTVNFTAPSGGTVSGNEITVSGQGVWTYVPASGMITFDPEAGFAGNPTALTYTITETSTGLTSNISSETITYLPVLPVDLISFTGKQIDQHVMLVWKTANEVNFSHFEILKSTNNAKEFGSIGKVISSGQNSYQYADRELSDGVNYYKLSMVDLDGTSKLSKIISVRYDKNATFTSGRVSNANFQGVTEINFYPNPVAEVLSLKGVDWEVVKSVEIVNSLGSVLLIKTSPTAHGIDLASLSKGVYIGRVTLTDGTVITQKIVVDK